MTQAKLKIADNEGTKKNVEKDEHLKSKYLSDKCVQIAAWVLLTLGLCIIVTTFYLAIIQRDGEDIFDDDESEADNADKYDKNGEDMNVNIVARIVDKKIIKLEKLKIKGCEAKFCKILCNEADDIFKALYDSMELSNCTYLDTLAINRQQFRRGILRNDWHYAERTVQELALVNSNITIIRSAAFNTPLFSTTFLLYWRNLNLQNIEGGALLGLHSLKYLMIDTKIDCLDRAFFQPVQTTLVYLKLHAELTVSKDENIFGISLMERLEYADLSRNNFNGFITKNTFKGTPNLKYLIMARNRVTGITPDAFTHLNGKLFLLDLSHNMLTTLGYEVMAPLLAASDRTFVNFAMNSWVCNCGIRPLARVYREYRSQFMDALYCKAPHSLYGRFIDEVDMVSQYCDTVSSTIPEQVKSDETEWTSTWAPLRNETHSETTDFMDLSTSTESRNIHLRCWSLYDAESNSAAEKSESKSMEFLSNNIVSIEDSASMPLNVFHVEDADASSSSISEIQGTSAKRDYFDFEEPVVFELQLYENYSVKITVPYHNDPKKQEIHIIWFGEDMEKSLRSNTPCLRYTGPYVITDPLSPNETYTFCCVYADYNPISPFNCLPLHAPAERDIEEDIWIPRDQKPFTIGMLCLIFLISIFSGAIIAYFAIKAYPDLLEGSKNVLVVKKSDKTCYISTISETDYKKKPSFSKKPSNSSIHKKISSKQSSVTLSEGSNSASNLTRLSSVKSSSTFFEDAFPPLQHADDEYEMPKPMDKFELTYESRSTPNTYVATSPCRSPPPLPKRNSKSFTENIY